MDSSPSFVVRKKYIKDDKIGSFLIHYQSSTGRKVQTIS